LTKGLPSSDPATDCILDCPGANRWPAAAIAKFGMLFRVHSDSSIIAKTPTPRLAPDDRNVRFLPQQFRIACRGAVWIESLTCSAFFHPLPRKATLIHRIIPPLYAE
jgi:hypothetical protein